MYGLAMLLYFGWLILMYVQMFLGYGTAYRWTKKGGDNGLALFGWMIVTGLAAIIPGLGIYLWIESRKNEVKSSPALTAQQKKFCTKCGKEQNETIKFCTNCGNQM